MAAYALLFLLLCIATLGSFLLGARPWMMTNTRVAASDVADRETLKDFVDGGVNYLHTLATLPEIMMF